MAIGDTTRDLKLEDGEGKIIHVSEYVYLGIRITKDWNYDPEFSDSVNNGRAGLFKVTFCGTAIWLLKQRLLFIMQFLKVQLHMQQKHGV